MLSNYSGSSFEDAGLYGEPRLVTLLNLNEVRPEGLFDGALIPARARTHARGIVKRSDRRVGRRVFRSALLTR